MAVECRFTAERLSRLSELEHWHFWFVGRRALMDRLLRRHVKDDRKTVLDLGCGTGSMMGNLARQGYRVCGLDIRSEGLQATNHALPESLLLQAEAPYLPFKADVFDIVLMLDILEHVDDLALLTEVQRVLQPGGCAMITAPAMTWLWSYRDEAAGHLRRYTRDQLECVVASAHLQMKEIRYYQCLGLPLVAITRFFGRGGPRMRDLEERPASILNNILTCLNLIEVGLSDIVRWPWGSSLVAVCRKV